MNFYILAAILLISAALVVTLRNIFHCALFLIVALLSLAALYFNLGAPLVGAMQLIIYVGATMILVIFAIMFTSRLSDKSALTSNQQILPALVAIGAFWAFTITTLRQTNFPEQLGRHFNPLVDLSLQLMQTYLLPFEVISLVLLAVLVGAIALARKD